ncbi:MAG: elongation factor P [Chlamydiota bacterium]|nr:elongation factor P [Chlamydiota bacterium]
MKAIELRPGKAIMWNGALHMVVEYQHHKPGKGSAMVQTILRNLSTGNSVKNRFRPDESVEEAFVESKACQFLYKDQQGFHFMDLSDYENYTLTLEKVGTLARYLKENLELKMRFYNHQVIDIDLPSSVLLRVMRTEPGVKGDTVTNVTKPAFLETGYEIGVPLFVNEGDNIKIDTRSGEYLGRG